MNADDALALLTIAENAEHELDGPDPLPALERLDARYDDLVAALRRFLEEGDTDRGPADGGGDVPLLAGAGTSRRRESMTTRGSA